MSLRLAAAVAAAAAAASSAAPCGSASGGPTDNPVATLYGSSDARLAWAAEVRWACVWSVADFPAASPDASFAAAQAAAVAGGGGVVYFPAGTYAFAQNLSLASGVVIRGAPTTARAKSGKAPGPLAPTTVFACPNKLHQGVWNFEPAAQNLGVVNVLLDQCAVMLWPALVTPSFSPMLSSWWFSATDVAGMGRNKLVLSNVVRDVSLGRSLLAPPPLDKSNVYPYTFSIAVGVYTDENALVANNLLPPSQRDEATTVTIAGKNETVPYAYDNRYGIDVNSILLGAVASAYCKGAGSKCGTPSAFGGLSPPCAPFNFRPGIVIRDNFVAQNGRVGVSWSGGANAAPTCAPGSGTLVTGNHVEVRANTTCWTVDGHSAPRGSDTNENRGYMLSGFCSNVTGNTGHVNRQLIPGTPYETVDGEGILHQSQNGNWGFGDVIVGNDLSGGESGYIANWDLLWQNESTMSGNTVNADEMIGAVLMNDDVVGAGWHCSGNSPPAVFKGKTTVPCPA